MTNDIEYALAIALIEKIVNDHCERLQREAGQHNATEQINTIKLALNKVRNG